MDGRDSTRIELCEKVSEWIYHSLWEWLSKNVTDNFQLKEYLGKIATSSEHLLSLINDILDMSRIESGKVKMEAKPLHLPELMHDLRTIIHPSVASKQLDFLLDTVDVVDEDIIADRMRLTQILLNVLSNAIKVSSKEGVGSEFAVCLTAYDWSDIEEEARQAGVTAFCEKPLFMSEIRDILTKPVPQKEKHSISIDDCRGKKILLVEDNSLNQEIAKTILEDAGFVIEIANDGSVAVEKMTIALPGQYDLILMDIQMPLMNGYDATKRIRAMNTPFCRQIPIIAMTANAFEEDKALALQAGMNDYLAKPIQIDRMLKAISRMLKD